MQKDVGDYAAFPSLVVLQTKRNQTDLSWVEQEDVIPEQFKWIRVSAAIVLLLIPCAYLVLHSSFMEKMCQKPALQNTGHFFQFRSLQGSGKEDKQDQH